MLSLLVLGLELLLGLALGFFISDNRPGLSLGDVKLSSVVFLMTTSFVMLTHPEMTVGVFAFLGIGWVAINFGMLVGELLRLGAIRYILNVVAKKDVQLSVSDFVQIATRFGFTGLEGDREAALVKLAEVYERLNRISQRVTQAEDAQTMRRVQVIGDLCRQYYDVACVLTGEQCEERRQVVLSTWGQMGNTLTELSWDTLNHAETCIKQKLDQAWNRTTIQEARGV